MRPRHRLLGAGAVLVAAVALGAATLPVPLQDVKPELKPVGHATLHWFGLHVYDIALFTEDGAYATNGSAVLSIRYNVSIRQRRLLETTRKEWQRLGLGGAAQHDAWVSRLAGLWPDVKSGDSLTAFRRRDGATAFFFGDRLLGDVADPAFGPAFFAIWLDKACRHPEVRDRLLGKERDARERTVKR